MYSRREVASNDLRGRVVHSERIVSHLLQSITATVPTRPAHVALSARTSLEEGNQAASRRGNTGITDSPAATERQ